jgi:8-oxo-dGTP pyrophosphatase MutT (NUDIX family)
MRYRQAYATAMAFPFTDAGRAALAARVAAFVPREVPSAGDPLKHAAVCLVVGPLEDGRAGETGFLLTRRAATLRAHRNQWALPGGRCDAGETAVEAALRELHEELSLRCAADAVLGTLDDYPTRSGYRITPVVVWIDDLADLVPNPHEVASVHRIPLAEIAALDAVDFVTIPESDRPVVRIRIRGDRIHAPTAAILYQFREVLAGRQTRVADLEQPVFAWR